MSGPSVNATSAGVAARPSGAMGRCGGGYGRHTWLDRPGGERKGIWVNRLGSKFSSWMVSHSYSWQKLRILYLTRRDTGCILRSIHGCERAFLWHPFFVVWKEPTKECKGRLVYVSVCREDKEGRLLRMRCVASGRVSCVAAIRRDPRGRGEVWVDFGVG